MHSYVPDSYPGVNGAGAYSCYGDEVDLGPRLRQLRRHHGWTQTQLAERLKIDQGTVSNVERGRGTTTEVLLSWLKECGGRLEIRGPEEIPENPAADLDPQERALIIRLVRALEATRGDPRARAFVEGAITGATAQYTEEPLLMVADHEAPTYKAKKQ